MRAKIRPPSSMGQRKEGDVEDSSLDVGVSIQSSLGVARFRTLRSEDKIVQTSLSRANVRDKDTDTDKFRTAVQDMPGEGREPDTDDVEPDDRARNILSLLTRKESLMILAEVLSADNPRVQQERLGRILLSSHDVLDSFARLVVEGGLMVSAGRLQPTALTERILRAISANEKPS